MVTPAGTSAGITFRYVGGGLPVTGGSTWSTVSVGVVLLIAGALALLAIRHRRRLTFVA